MGTYTLKQKSLWCGFYLKRNGGNVWCSTDLSEHPTVAGNDGKKELDISEGITNPVLSM